MPHIPPPLRPLSKAAMSDAALHDLAARFRGGTAAVIVEGDYTGVILSATLHPWLNALAATFGGPHPLRWQGKTFASGVGMAVGASGVEGTGENLWRHRVDPPGVLLAGMSRLCRWQARQHAGDVYRAVPFRVSHGPSIADEQHTVLRIMYDVTTNPLFIRRIRDELVDVGDGQYLGRGYYRLWGRWFPWVWFTLHTAHPVGDDWHR